MIVAGCDIGSTTVKAVILNNGKIFYGPLIKSLNPEISSSKAIEGALATAGLNSHNDIEYLVSTGYGRLRVNFANKDISEISCHGKGAQYFLPTVRTVIDIGGQDVKVIQLNKDGKMVDFVMNDRCAAGTGRFFESMARVLECGLEGISSKSNISETPCNITNQCTVFAESEVVTLLNEGKLFKNIITGINQSVASRVHSMARKLGIIEDIVVTGGCSKNDGLVEALNKQLDLNLKKMESDPQYIGAIGAALFAREILLEKGGNKTV